MPSVQIEGPVGLRTGFDGTFSVSGRSSRLGDVREQALEEAASVGATGQIRVDRVSGVGHQPHDVAPGVAEPRDVLRRTVRVVVRGVAHPHPPLRL